MHNFQLVLSIGEYAKQQLARYKALVSKLEAGKKQDANKKQELYDIAKDEFLSIINNLSIPFDDSSLDVYIDMHIQSGVDRDDIEAKYNVLSDIVADKKSGSIGYFITEKIIFYFFFVTITSYDKSLI